MFLFLIQCQSAARKRNFVWNLFRLVRVYFSPSICRLCGIFAPPTQVIFIAGDGPDVKRLGKEKFERPIGRVASQEDLAVLAKFTSTVERSFSPTATHSPSRCDPKG